jgi:Na+/proline symporter
VTAPFTPLQGWAVVGAYAFMVFLVTAAYARHESRTKEGFLVDHRQIKGRHGAFSVAATWIWAPALFLSAQKAYEQGIVGLTWFVLPNVSCLVLFAFFAERIRVLAPEGYSMSGLVLERYSRRAHTLFLVEGFGLQTCAFAVQLLAGGAVVSRLTGIAFWQLTVVLALVPLLYSLHSGLRASIATDYWQMIWILVVALATVPAVVLAAGGMDAVVAGLGGVSGRFSNLFDASGLEVFLAFGLPTSVGLLSGPFGDQMFWQRAFAMERRRVRSAFLWGAFVFALCPLSLSVLGFTLAGRGIVLPDTQLANVEAVWRWLPAWVLVPFLWMILSGLISTVDSVICAVSSYAGHDLLLRRTGAHDDAQALRAGRWAMIVVSVAAVLVANIQGLKILHLFLFYGTLRASVLLPTVLVLLTKSALSERGLFYGILGSMVLGLPLQTLGQWAKSPLLLSGGSLVTVSLSGAVLVALTAVERRNAGPRDVG